MTWDYFLKMISFAILAIYPVFAFFEDMKYEDEKIRKIIEEAEKEIRERRIKERDRYYGD